MRRRAVGDFAECSQRALSISPVEGNGSGLVGPIIGLQLGQSRIIDRQSWGQFGRGALVRPTGDEDSALNLDPSSHIRMISPEDGDRARKVCSA